MQIQFAPLALPTPDAAVFFVEKDKPLAGIAAEADSLSGGALSQAASTGRFTGDRGQKLEVLGAAGLPCPRNLLIGIGDASDLTDQDNVEIGAAATAALLTSGAERVSIVVEHDGLDPVAVAEGAYLRTYRFDKYRTKEPATKKPTVKTLVIESSNEKAEAVFDARKAVVEGVFLTRDLVSEPANILNPESFADRVKELSADGIDVEILGEAEMEKLGMGSLLGVGQGSDKESKLAIMRWNGAGDDDQPVAFVGKGVTFDTGGISLKPAEGMDMMKWDMGGAGTVVGAMKALAGRKAKVNVVAIVGLVENMPGGNAQRPGDVVTSMSGQTIEVLNTDAEGRLVLADAMWYCQDRFKPKFMVDLATLTGAIIVSFGHEYAGIFTDSDELSNQLTKAGTDTGDKVWRMPIHKNYDKMIDTPTADMKNIGGRAAGSITAAQFLKRFTNGVPWCHIDIAGTVWSDKDLPLSEKGGTGFGVRLLDKFIADNHEA